MKILLIGSNGAIGKAIAASLKDESIEIVPVNLHSGDLSVDISSEDSIRQMFEVIGVFDGLICAAGSAYAGPLEKMGTKEIYKGIQSKLMGQVNLVMIGKQYINPKGFFTLTSGNLADEPAKYSAGLGLVNGALNGFVINAALEMPNGIRLNVVSPSVLLESVEKYGEQEGRYPIPGKDVAEAYKRTVYENITGEVIRIFGKPRQ